MATLKDLKVTELNNSNYSRWRVQVEDVLTGEGVWNIVDGTYAKPVDDPADDKVHLLFTKWIAGDGKARSIIRATVDEATFNQVRDCKTSHEILERVKELREPRTGCDLMTALTEFFCVKWRETDDVNTFMATLHVLAAKIDACGKQVKAGDEWIISKALACLPEKYGSFVASWNMMSGSDPKLSVFREKLFLAEQMMKGQGASTSGESMYTKGKHIPNVATKQKFMGECYECNKQGHMARNCPLKQNSSGKGQQKALKKPGNHNGGKKESMMVSAFHVSESSDNIIADSGATHHITNKHHWFTTLTELEVPKPFLVGNNACMNATHIGSIDVEVSVDGSAWREVVWNDVYYSKDACSSTLLSTVALEEKGFTFRHANGKMMLSRNGQDFLGGVRGTGASYRPYMKIVLPSGTALASQSMELWHQRLGHVSDDMLQAMVRNNVATGLEVVNSARGDCSACHLGRQTANSHDTREVRASLPGQRFHSDLCHMGADSWDGHRYFMTFKDENSGYRMVRTLTSKHTVANVFKDLLDTAERDTGQKALSIRTDNGTEYINKDVESLLHERGINHETCAAYVKEGNGMAERENRTLCDTARAMLFNADLTKLERNLLWNEAVVTAAYLRNRVPNRGKFDTTPYELWYGKKPSVSHLRVFGSTAYVKVPEEQRKKLDPKAVKTIFVGYDWDTTQILRVFNRDAKRVERVGNVVVPDGSDAHQIALPVPVPLEDGLPESDVGVETEQDENQSRKPGRPKGSKSAVKDPPPPHPMHTRSKDAALHVMAVAMDPSTVTDALSRGDANLWKDAMDDEMNSLKKNGTWELERLPYGRRTVKCKWVFKSKTRPDGSLEKRKARLVACGYTQTHGIDYDETFAPVVRHESVRCVLAAAASRNMEMVQFDVKTAFLNGELDETIYMEQPAGYDDGSGRVCLLKRSLYGLKQSPRKWNERINTVLLECGFVPCEEDTCVYVRIQPDGDVMILCLYVDDGLLCGTTGGSIENFLKKLKREFDVTVHNPDYYVGMEITRDRKLGTIRVNQRGYICRVIQRFGLENGKTYSSPLEPNMKLGKTSDEEEEYDCPYLEAIGCLIYISTISRPDITFAVNRLATFAKKPSYTHWVMVKRVIRYLKGTLDSTITYGTGAMELVGYCDSDWGGDVDERRSTSGYVFTLGGGPIAWNSQLQKVTAFSATEAEYMALAEAVKQNEWTRPFLEAVGVDVSKPTAIFADNQGAIALSKNPEYHKRTKHVGIRYHRIRQECRVGSIEIRYIPTDQNLSDMLTKGLGGSKIKHINGLLGLQDAGALSEGECLK